MINLFDAKKGPNSQFNRKAWVNQTQPNPVPPNPPPQNRSTIKVSQQNFSELVDLLKNFVGETAKTKREEAKDHLRQKYQIEARDKEVYLPLPEASEKIDEKVLKQWIAEVTKTVFSSAFYEYSKANMSFQQTKIFCSENILKNISRLNQKCYLNAKEFEVINSHLVRRVLPYLGQKYPLTDSAEINKKLLSVVEEIDNIEELQNNYFSHSKIMFEYRKEGNYYDLIMKVINDLLNKIDNVTESGKTNFQEFEKFMAKIFEKTYDFQWMNANQELQMAFLEECLKFIEPDIEEQHHSHSPSPLRIISSIIPSHKPKDKEKHVIRHGHEVQSPEHRQGLKKEKNEEKEKEREARKQQRKRKEQAQKYKAGVKQYTSFLIGRKIPQNVPLFSEQEISQNKLSIKHPAILRILTKWFEQLWKKFEKNYFINRSESIKLQRGESVHDLKPEYRRVIDQLMSDQKRKITLYIDNIQKLNYKLEAGILKIEQSFAGEDEMDELERICGKFSYKIVKNLHSEIIEYLNKVIHSILLVSKRFHQYVLDPKKSESEKSNWPFPPNLISFKVGDLMRCKLSSKEQQVIRIYNQLIRLSRSKQYGKKFKIVRIKNRLKDSTNDILINVRFNGQILCEIQLAIKSHASDFIKKSNAFHHYIYELQRSQFGPITELCSIWMSLDNRGKVYEDLVSRQTREALVKMTQKACRCAEYMVEIKTDQPFICDQCTQIYLHSNYILNHTKCSNCFKYYLCAKCRIFQQDFEVLRDKLILQKKIEKDSQISNKKQLRDSCVKLINKAWQEFENGRERYCLCIFIESQKIKVKTFKLLFYNSKKYLLGRRQNGEFYQIGDINDNYFLKELQAQNVLIQIRENEGILKFEDIVAIKEYVLPKIVRQTYRKYKESIVLHVKAKDEHSRKLTNRDTTNILMSGNKAQRQKLKNIFAADNYLTQLPCQPEDFPNIQSLVLSRNPITSFDGLDKFKFLKSLVMQNDDGKCKVQITAVLEKFSHLEYLQKLVLSHFQVQSIPASFRSLKRLKCLELEWCRLQEIQNLGDCTHLEKVNVSHNRLSKLPQHVSHLQKLQTLILHDNPIEIISTPHFHRPTQTKDSHLSNLDLSECNLTQLTLNVHLLSNIESLNLQHNLLTHLQPELFASLGKLRMLNLSHNLLKVVPNLSSCSRLAKLYISYNHIEELPSFLAKMPVLDFKFEGCPIKKIHCVEWLKNILDESSCILQKFLICYQKIPSISYATFNSKYVTKLINTNTNDELSQADQNDDLPQLSQKSRIHQQLGSEIHSDEENDTESRSQTESVSLQKMSSQSSNNYANCYLKLKKRISLQSHKSLQSSSESESQIEDNIKTQQELQTQEPDSYELEEKIAETFTQAKIDHYFAADQVFVMDFQSKIKHLQDNTLTFKEFNLYHDEKQNVTPINFIKMVENLGYSHSVINIYSGAFDNVQQHYEKIKSLSNSQNSQIFYQDLRRDKIPFGCITTLSDSKVAEIRNIEVKQLPTQVLSSQLQKLSIYKASAIPERLSECLNLKSLKIRKSQLAIVPSFLGRLTQLQQLDLSKNMIQTLQKQIFFELTHLKVLLLQSNRLKEMPEIYRCIRLHKLSISHNPLQIIPESMNLLVNLKQFDFEGCPITTIRCASWLTSRIDPEESIILQCQLSLAKLHNSHQLRFSNHYSTHKYFRWSQREDRDEDEVYQIWNQAEENKAVLFQYKFNQQQFLGKFSQQEFIALKFIKKTKYEAEAITYYREFKVIVDKKYPTAVDKFKQFLQLYSLESTKITLSSVDFIDVPVIQSPQCYFCSTNLDFPFYWLKWQPPGVEEWVRFQQKPKFGCRNCIQSQGEAPEYYKYKNNAILLFKKLKMYKMPSDNIGQNLQPKSLQNVNRHNFQCFGCKNKYFQRGEPRYLCLGCKTSFAEKKQKFMDLCKGCVDGLANRDEKLVKKMRAENHRHWHPLLRVLFNTEGYFNY